MKMQTPQGPKFVAVPISAMNVVGQPAAAAPTAQLTLPNGQIVVSGSQSLQPAAASLQPQQQQLMTWAPSSTATLPSSLSSVIMSSAALQPTSSTLISSPLMSPVTVVSSSPYGTVSSTPVTSFSGSKKKKSKKRKRDESEGGLDLGAVIKDAGLDLEEFGLTESGEQQTQNQLLSDVSATAGTSASSLGGYKLVQTSSQLPTPTQTQQPQFTATAVAASPSVPQHAQLVASSSGSQLVAQIQQPLPIQVRLKLPQIS